MQTRPQDMLYLLVLHGKNLLHNGASMLHYTWPVVLKADVCQKCSMFSNFNTFNTLQRANNPNFICLLILSGFASPPDPFVMRGIWAEISYLCYNSTCMTIGGGALPPVFFVRVICMCIRVMCHTTGVIDVCLS